MKIVYTKSSKGTNVYIIKSFRSRGKSTSQVVEKLGKLEDLNKKYGDGKLFIENRRRELEKEDSHFDSVKKQLNLLADVEKLGQDSSYKIGGHLPLRKVFRGLGLHEILRDIQEKTRIEFSLEKAVETMIFNRILQPSSKLSTCDFARKLVDNPNLELQHYYRAMDALVGEIDNIQKQCYKNSSKIINKDKKILYYDCTNYYCETETAKEGELRQFGVSKEHRPNPIVQMGLFTDGRGIPLAFNINPGNTNEQVTLKPLEEKIINDFGMDKIVVCTDAGLASYNNRAFNDRQGRAFIVTQSIKKLPKHLKKWATSQEGWKKLSTDKPGFKPSMIDDLEEGTILYKCRYMKETVEVKDAYDNKVKIEQGWRLIVTFSKDYAVYQKQIRNAQIERAKKLIQNPDKFNKVNSNDCRRFVKGISFDKNGEIIKTELSFDEELVKKEEQFDGFYGLTTNLGDDVKEIVAINHNRWKVEQCFRILKTDFSARPIYHYKDDRIKVHFLICFLALLIFRLFQQKIKKPGFNETSSNKILDCLKDINFCQLENGYVNLYEPNETIKDIAEVFDFSYITRGAYKLDQMQHLINLSKRY